MILIREGNHPPRELSYVLIAIPIAFLAGWAIGGYDDRLRLLSIVAISLPAILFASLRVPIACFVCTVFICIFADNFAGSPISLTSHFDFPAPMGDVLLLVLALGLIALRLMSQARLRGPAFISGWVLWIAVMFQATLRAPNSGTALRYFIQIGVVPVAIALILSNIPWSWRHYLNLTKMLTVLAVLVAGMAVIEQLIGQTLLGSSRRTAYLEEYNSFQVGDLTRVGGVFGQPDWFGGFMTLFLMLPVGFSMATRRPSVRLGWIAAEILLVAAMLASGTRLALVGGAVSVLAFIFFGAYLKVVNRAMLAAAIGGMVLIGGLIISSPDVEPLNRLNVVSSRISSTSGDDVDIRIGAAVTGLRVAATHPLQGIGLDYEQYMKASLAVMDPRQSRPLAQPHNSYIELAAFAGFPALVVLGYLVTINTRRIWNSLKRGRAVDPIRLSVMSSLLGFLLSNTLVNLLTLPAISYCFWALLLSTSISRSEVDVEEN